jgi:hypothetical protein
MVSPARARVDGWTIGQAGWPALGPGLSRVYRAGHRALARAAAEPSAENLHEWRKQAKYLWHGLQLLTPAWVSREKDLADRVHDLTRLLGKEHDLAALRDVLTADPGGHGGHRVLKDLLARLDRRRARLREQAFALGRSLYAEPPSVFTRRMEGYWDAWGPETAGRARQVVGTGEKKRTATARGRKRAA